MAIIKLDISLPENATNEQISDALLKLKRELEWLLNGNIDDKNLKTVLNVTSLTISEGTPLNTLTMNDSAATTVEGLRNDFNTLLQKLRASNILNG
jgi:hypothetical protein